MRLPFVHPALGLLLTPIPLPSSPWTYFPTTSVGGPSFLLPTSKQQYSHPWMTSIACRVQDDDTAKCSSSEGTPPAARASSLGEAMRFLGLGYAYNEEGNTSAAVEAFRRAVELEPRSAVARAELGRALIRCGMRSEGFESLVAAFELDSLCAGVKDGFGDYYRAEIEADRGNVDLHEGLAALCMDSARPEEGAKCYQTCLDLESSRNHTETSGKDHEGDARRARRDRWSVALFKCHASLCMWDDWDEKARGLRAAVRRGAGSEVVSSQGAGSGNFEKERDSIVGVRGKERTSRADTTSRRANVGAEGDFDRTGSSLSNYDGSDDNDDGGSTSERFCFPPAIHPFDSLSAPLSIGDCLAVAQQQSRRVLAEARAREGISSTGGLAKSLDKHSARRWQRRVPDGADGGRLRLGYVSGDLMGTHPLTHLMQSVFGMHDRGNFEVFVYALNPSDGSKARRRVERGAEYFRDLGALTAREAAQLISDDGINVLVNLNGYAGTARSADIFALRPATVAVSYMGFPGTMGSCDIVDYILADGVVIPPDMRHHYSEKVLEMPHCYFVNDYRQSELAAISTPLPDRSDHGLPARAATARDHERVGKSGGTGGDGGVVLCNFNRLHKIDPRTFGAWMKVLRNVPQTVLWLLDGGETACSNLRRQASLHGVDGKRLVFAPLVGKEEHLKRLGLADLFVDTPLYNAHTVGCDALWAGVPMVTLRGERMASRVGASLVEAAGLPELVTDTMEGYVALVEELASNHQKRRSIRRRLEEARLTCPLFDTQQWVLHAECAFRCAWDRHQAGLPPAHITVDASQNTWRR